MERLTLAAMQHLPTAVLFVMDLTGQCGTSVPTQWRIRCVSLQPLMRNVLNKTCRLKNRHCTSEQNLQAEEQALHQRDRAANPLLSNAGAHKHLSGARRGELRRRFAGKPWLDVFSKADLLEEEFDAAEDLLAAGFDDAAEWDVATGSSQPADRSCHDSSNPAPDPGRHPAESTALLEDLMRGDSCGDPAESAAHVSTAGGSSSQPGTAVEVAAALRRAVRASSVTGAGLDPLKVIFSQGVA